MLSKKVSERGNKDINLSKQETAGIDFPDLLQIKVSNFLDCCGIRALVNFHSMQFKMAYNFKRRFLGGW